ncbi:hypothetical protein M0R45_015419 [Rubus argutus]|uniref:Uncharacterized protein n=1 Tax=Rubus argutus TaxID=59490 RepID=A0AAW1XQT2_RUBAR
MVVTTSKVVEVTSQVVEPCKDNTKSSGLEDLTCMQGANTTLEAVRSHKKKAGRNDTLKDRVARIEDFLGAPVMDDVVNLSVQVEQLRVELVGLRETFNQHSREMEERTETSVLDMIALLDSIKARLDALDGEMVLVKRTTTN